MPPKTKPKKGKSGKKGKGMSIDEYDVAIAEANQQLEQLNNKKLPIEQQAIELQNHIQQLIEDFEDIKKYLNNELKNEQKEVSKLDGTLEFFTDELSKQMENFRIIFEEKTNTIETLRGEQRDIIDALEKTLKSMETLQQEQKDYVHKEKEITLREETLQVQHAKELHELDEKLRIDQATRRKLLNEQLDAVSKPISEMNEDREELNNGLKDQFEKSCSKFIKLIEKHDRLAQDKFHSDLELDLLNQRVELIKRKNSKREAATKESAKRTDEKEVEHYECLGDSQNEEIFEYENFSADDNPSENTTWSLYYDKMYNKIPPESTQINSPCDNILQLLISIEEKVNEAMKTREKDTELDSERRSFTMEELEETYVIVDEAIRQIIEMIQVFWKQEETEKMATKGLANGIEGILTPKPRQREIYPPQYAKLQRYELYKNWRTPKDRTLRLYTE